MVIWLVGMSGAGKSTIGRCLYSKLKKDKPGTVFVDGDEIRSLFNHDKVDGAYTLAGRKINAKRIQSICRWLDAQGLNVVCCILSIFQDISDENRNIFSEYREIFIDVPLSVLMERDNKGIYQAALSGLQCNVVGVDIEYFPPEYPDLVILNSFEEVLLPEYVNSIINLCERGIK